MNALLIHNDNLPTTLIDHFDSTLKFDITQAKMLEIGYSFDRETHLQLNNALVGRKFNVIFLPFNLSNQNYLELTGMRLAAHIRLTPEFEHSRVPIVFIGSETKEQIAKLTNLDRVLFSSGTFSTTSFKIEKIKKQYQWIIDNKESLSNIEYDNFINNLNLPPPVNYDSHHSTDNEWAMYRWSEYIGCSDKIPDIKNHLKTSLYFKWLSCSNPIIPAEGKQIKNLENIEPTKILLIDDEASKGWHMFYQELFSNYPSIKIDFLDIKFNGQNRVSTANAALHKVKKTNPDIILLDLRLSDEDFYTNVKPSDLTGTKILKSVKEYNKGIQVIITTASNKVWNYQILKEIGADGYIIKSRQSDITEDLSNLNRSIYESSKRAKFLKRTNIKFTRINDLINGSNEHSIEFKHNVKNNIEILFQLLVNSFKSDKYKNYSYLQLFLILEEYLKQPSVFDEGDDSYVVTQERKFLVLSLKNPANKSKGYNSAISFNHGHYEIGRSTYNNRFIDTNFKMSSLLMFKYGLSSSGERGWTSIYKVRNNKAAHPENDIVSYNEFEKLLDFMIYILNDHNIKLGDEKKALKEISFEDKVKNLTQKWSNH